VLKRIFDPKKDDVTGGWTKLQIEELHKLYSTQNIVMFIKSGGGGEMGAPYSTHGEYKNAFITVVRKRERKIPLQTPRHK
jgi:hypothetical protein